MHREPLLRLLAAYSPLDPAEWRAQAEIVAFVREQSDCFSRALTVGHITGSAWVLNRDGSRVLLTHHRKLGKWLQLGGHADGDSDVLSVALREACEESGLSDIVPVTPEIFDVDVHIIPARGSEPEHRHYDIRFLLQVLGDGCFQVSDESHELAWVSQKELLGLNPDASVVRMHGKWLKRREGLRPAAAL